MFLEPIHYNVQHLDIYNISSHLSIFFCHMCTLSATGTCEAPSYSLCKTEQNIVEKAADNKSGLLTSPCDRMDVTADVPIIVGACNGVKRECL